MTEQVMQELAKEAAISTVGVIKNGIGYEKAVDIFVESYIYAMQKLKQRTKEMQITTMQELAKEAALSAVRVVENGFSYEKAVDIFVESYIYAMQKLKQRSIDPRKETTQEFGNNSLKFR